MFSLSHTHTCLLAPIYLNAGGTRESLCVTDHAHIISILLQLRCVLHTAVVETRKTVRLSQHPAARVSAGKRPVTHLLRPLQARSITADITHLVQSSVDRASTETTRTFPSSYIWEEDVPVRVIITPGRTSRIRVKDGHIINAISQEHTQTK